MVPEGQVVQGVPLAPRLGHPGTKQRERFGGSAELGVRERGVLPPNTGTHLLPLQARLPWHPREPWGPHFTLQRDQWGSAGGKARGWLFPITLPPPPPHLQVCHLRQDLPRDDREGTGQCAGR